MVQMLEDPDPVGTGEYLGRWLAHVRGRVRTKTHEGYEALIRRYALPAIGGTPLNETTPLDLQRLYSSLLADPDHPISAGTVLNLHLVLTQGSVRRSGGASLDPTQRRVHSRRGLGEPSWRLWMPHSRGGSSRRSKGIRWNSMRDRDRMGMRRGEILGLRWGDIKRSLQAARVYGRERGTSTSSSRLPTFGDSNTNPSLPEFLVSHLTGEK
jgi:hypothetical protein